MKVQLIVELDIEMDTDSFDTHARIAKKYMNALFQAYNNLQRECLGASKDTCVFEGARVIYHDLVVLKVLDEDKVHA